MKMHFNALALFMAFLPGVVASLCEYPIMLASYPTSGAARVTARPLAGATQFPTFEDITRGPESSIVVSADQNQGFFLAQSFPMFEGLSYSYSYSYFAYDSNADFFSCGFYKEDDDDEYWLAQCTELDSINTGIARITNVALNDNCTVTSFDWIFTSTSASANSLIVERARAGEVQTDDTNNDDANNDNATNNDDVNDDTDDGNDDTADDNSGGSTHCFCVCGKNSEIDFDLLMDSCMSCDADACQAYASIIPSYGGCVVTRCE